MLGRTHAVHGATAGLLVGMLAPSSAVSLVCGAVGCAGSMVPDADHPSGMLPRMLGPFGFVVSSPVRLLSVALTGVAHRGISHSLVAALATGVFSSLLAGWLGAELATAVVLGLAAAAGVVAALAGDAVTHAGLDHVFWPVPVRLRLPKWIAIRTGKRPEQLVVFPLSVAVAVGAGWGVVAVWT